MADVSGTLVSMFFRQVAKAGSSTALVCHRDGRFVEITWNALADDVRRAAAALQRLGVLPGDRVVLVSENRYEWIVLDQAIMLARGVHVPLHSTLAGVQIAAQIQDCDPQLVLLSDEEQRVKLTGLAEPLSGEIQCMSLDQFSEALDDSMLDEAELLKTIQPEDLATILYTSGTTGEPKGVMLSHRNLFGNARATHEAFALESDDLRLSFLPWSHVFARTCDLYTWMASGAVLAIAQSREKILANCEELRPTVLNGVPYFFDGLFRFLRQQGTHETPGSLQQLFGGRMRMCCSGGATLPRHVAEWFERQQVPLIEGYGLTETSPVISCCRPEANRIGSIGFPVAGVEVRLTDDGEILTRGESVMQGYYRNERATAEAIRDGWFYTGDLGKFDDDGFLSIIGRKKELIVTAAGKNIAPVYLEGLLTQDPLIRQVMILGEGRKFLSALIVPEMAMLRARLTEEHDVTMSDQELLTHGDVQALFEACLSDRLAGVSRSEQIRSFRLLPREFTLEHGELTPTLKLRRSVIMANFSDAIEAIYHEETL